MKIYKKFQILNIFRIKFPRIFTENLRILNKIYEKICNFTKFQITLVISIKILRFTPINGVENDKLFMFIQGMTKE